MTEPEVRALRPLVREDATDGDLRGALEARTGHEPSAADLRGLADRLAAMLPPGSLPPAGSPPAPTGGGAGTLSSLGGAGKLAVAVTIGALVASGVWVQRSVTPATPHLAPSVSVSVSVSAFAPTPATAASDPTIPSPALEPSATATRHDGPLASPKSASSVPEATILAKAHGELLHGSPEKALATTGEHERWYPNGALAQEREVISIEALMRLDRREEAQARAAAFHRAHPSSSHGARIDRLVGGSAP